MTPDGGVTTFAGKVGEVGAIDGVGTAARFNRPSGLAIDRSDNLYIAGLVKSMPTRWLFKLHQPSLGCASRT